MKTHEITDEELKVLKKKALDALSHSRHCILSKYPFIGSIALRMDLVPVRDIRVRTACTDGNAVYFDIAFLSSLSEDERIFVLAHEVWHAVLMHLTRRGTRHPALFNIATDKEVNYLLKQDGLTPPPDLCFPEGDEVGKCAEEIYEMMLKKQQQQQKKQSKANNQSNGSSNGKNNQKSSSSKNSGNQSGQDEDSNGQPDSSGNQNGELKGQFDKHVYEGEEQSDTKGNDNGDQPNGNGNGKGADYKSKITDKYGDVGLDSDFQPSVPKGFADRMRETIISEAQRVEKMKGNVPAAVKELVKSIMTPEIRWEEVLAQFVTRCYNSGNRSWIPPNRRHVHNDVYLQSRQASKIKLAVGIDTSGSTGNDRGKFLGELASLVRSFGNFDITIIECDAEVGAVKHYTQDDDLEHEIENGEYAMTGGGGTAMTPIYNYILDHQVECDAIVIMTDGYIDSIPKNPIPSLPTLWIITKDGTEDFCDWGQKIHLKQNDDDVR